MNSFDDQVLVLDRLIAQQDCDGVRRFIESVDNFPRFVFGLSQICFPPLFAAINVGCVEIVDIVTSRVPPFVTQCAVPIPGRYTEIRRTALSYAIEKGADEIAFLLLGSFASFLAEERLLPPGWSNYEYPLDEYQTPAHCCARFGRLAVLNHIISNGLDDVSCHHFVSRTLLMTASTHGQTEIVQYLLANGANVMARDACGMTALATRPRWRGERAARRAEAATRDIGRPGR